MRSFATKKNDDKAIEEAEEKPVKKRGRPAKAAKLEAEEGSTEATPVKKPRASRAKKVDETA